MEIKGVVRSFNELTPVTKDAEDSHLFYKRDDLYYPYGDLPIRGNKVRQLRSLILNNIDYIREECSGNIYIGLFSSSCQGVVLSRVAREIDPSLKVRVFHGGMTQNSVKKNKLCLNAIVQGATIDLSARAGYDNVIQAQLVRCKESGIRFFDANLSHNIYDYPESVLYTIANQAENLPQNIHRLFVPVGSGITMAGVLIGLMEYDKNVEEVVGLCVSDNYCEYEKKIREIVEMVYGRCIGFFCRDCETGYHKKVVHNIIDSFGQSELDYIYEAKAYDTAMKYRHGKGSGSYPDVFWISGNMSGIRDKVFGLREALLG